MELELPEIIWETFQYTREIGCVFPVKEVMKKKILLRKSKQFALKLAISK